MATIVPLHLRTSSWSLAAAFCFTLLAACGGGSTSSTVDAGSPIAATPDPSSDSPSPLPTNPASPPGSTPAPAPNPGGSAATDVVLGLAWQPNPDSIAGYIVYYGPSASAATALATQLSSSNTAFAQAPSVSFNAGSDLGLKHGDSVCFRLRAYNAANLLSDWSQAACATI